MIKSKVIVITEVDDIEYAMEELDEQLATLELLTNTVGIVSVQPDFIDSDVYTAIAKAIKFPLVGMTTFSQLTNDKMGMFLLSILVLTSDTCEFACGGATITDGDTATQVINKCYDDVRAKLKDDPKIAFLYSPFFESDYSGLISRCIQSLSDKNENLPIFGSLACREIKTLSQAKSIYGEEASSQKLVLLLVSGDISPEFYTSSVVEDALAVANIGEVTAAKDNYIYEINGINAKDFLSKLDFLADKNLDELIGSTIFITETKDENGKVLTSRGQLIISLNDEYVALEDHIDLGTVLSLAILTRETIKTSAQYVVNQVKKYDSGKTALIYSCLGRWLVAGDDMEFSYIKDELANRFNIMVVHSGGEISPVSIKGEKIKNAKLSASIVACVF